MTARPRSSVASNKEISSPTLTAAEDVRVLSVRPDTLDFRDRMFEPTLVEVPLRRTLDDYCSAGVPILDQGREGACTGFGLATMVHYLLRTRKVERSEDMVSPNMLYDMARRYDEWAGENYSGSSCRGAIKGWFKHGVCDTKLWPKSLGEAAVVNHAIATDASRRPLGAYFRVNHQDLVAMHCAITEAGILYASAAVHQGWQRVGKDGVIAYPGGNMIGGHAFAIVAYDEEGLWIQNSWGTKWGKKGFARISYEDWLANGSDVWAARLAVPTRRGAVDAVSSLAHGAAQIPALALSELRPHVINVGNDGKLDPKGDIGTTPETLAEIVRGDIPRLTKGWSKRRIVLYAHGGLVGKSNALQRVNDYRAAMLGAECYPLAFIWKTDFWTTVRNILADANRQRRPEGFIDDSRNFMLDRLDDLLEPAARTLGGKAVWNEMKENAELATLRKPGDGAARQLADLLAADKDIELHLVAHSAGSIFFARFVEYWTKTLGLPVATCTLWAPACTTALFKKHYLPAIDSGKIERFTLFTLTDQTEQNDNCAKIYNKSLLYLVSNAFEERFRIPIFRPDGEAILGMEKFVEKDKAIKALFKGKKAVHEWIRSPAGLPEGDPYASEAQHHGDFDDDRFTVKATLARILAAKKGFHGTVSFARSASSRRSMRERLSD
ncbi:C1 family peptidase [Gimibacter soli]|uniref:C1 family peptidase n=1 Tax=Gimibacter soli TaxID=3024400 RepID=A0AAF0BML7_9PROT|nr:C1 family peptidase [Gimibacter soli]WCL54735.1 C1 family peptidase [Gimibacter soli]